MKLLSPKTAAFLLLFAAACNPSSRGIIIACVGDSLTDSTYPRHLSKALADEGIRSKILNYGRSGFTSGEYLSYLEENQAVLAAERPDYILVQLGTNDVRMDHDRTSQEQFSANMQNILNKLSMLQNPEGKKSQILLATIPPIPSGTPFPFSPESQNRVQDEINPLIIRIGKEKKIPIVDNYSLFLENPHFLPEVHPSEDGYKHLAHNWFAALKPLLK